MAPTALGQRLYDSYQGPKWLHVERGAGHNALSLHPAAVWWQEVSEFLASA